MFVIFCLLFFFFIYILLCESTQFFDDKIFLNAEELGTS